MPRYDQTQAECLVFTFKEGLLSKIAHDLKVFHSKSSARPRHGVGGYRDCIAVVNASTPY